MNIYVATAFPNLPEARGVMACLRDHGHTISHDWTGERIDPSWPLERQHAYLQECGAADLRGVLNADALVLVNHELSRDAMTEFGVAIGVGIPVYVLYPDRRASVFFHKAHLCSSVPALLQALK